MKAYIVTTGTLFGLIVVAHVLRIVAEPHLAADPWYILLTAAAAEMITLGLAAGAKHAALAVRATLQLSLPWTGSASADGPGRPRAPIRWFRTVRP